MPANPKYRYVYVLWGFLENLFFGGLLFGWGSLVFVLKEDGVFSHLCPETESTTTTTMNDTVGDISSTPGAALLTNSSGNALTPEVESCVEQDNMLSLVFSIASAVFCVGTWVIGQVNFKFGTRVTRICVHVLFLSGALFTAFTSKEVPWLLFFGPSLFSVAGMGILVTNLQFSILFSEGVAVVSGLYNGALDVSLIFMLVIKLLHQQGVALRWQMVTIAVVSLLTLVNTFLFLPRTFIYKKTPPQSHGVEVSGEDERDPADSRHGLGPETEDTLTSPLSGIDGTSDPLKIPPLRQVLSSPAYLLHVVWGSLLTLRHFCYFGLLNRWLEELTTSKEEVSATIDFAFYTQMCAVVTTPLAGALYDKVRKPFADSLSKKRRDLLPSVLPLTLASILGMTLSVLMSIPSADVIYPTIVVFVLFQSFLFCTGSAYIISVFPSEHMGALMGLWKMSAGIFGLVQYGLYTWAETTGTQQVNYLLTAVTALSLCHPFYQWWSCQQREATHPTNLKPLLNQGQIQLT